MRRCPVAALRKRWHQAESHEPSKPPFQSLPYLRWVNTVIPPPPPNGSAPTSTAATHKAQRGHTAPRDASQLRTSAPTTGCCQRTPDLTSAPVRFPLQLQFQAVQELDRSVAELERLQLGLAPSWVVALVADTRVLRAYSQVRGRVHALGGRSRWVADVLTW